jgi:hypothetical protein
MYYLFLFCSSYTFGIITEIMLKLCMYRHFMLIVRFNIQKKSSTDSVNMYLPVTGNILR